MSPGSHLTTPASKGWDSNPHRMASKTTALPFGHLWCTIPGGVEPPSTASKAAALPIKLRDGICPLAATDGSRTHMPKATDLQSTASPLCYGREPRFRPDLNRHCYGRNVAFYRIKLQKQLPMGVEPTPYGLQNQCSTIKLGKQSHPWGS